MKRIIHIAPALPPAIDGLGDFCKILVDNLEREGFTDNSFLIRRTIGFPSDTRIRLFTPRSFYQELERQQADVVILHYVGYAYNKQGMPFYIANGLRRYKRLTGCRLLVFFHELYSSSDSILELAFYTNPLQKLIVKRLAGIADAVFTSCGTYRELLGHLLGRDQRQPVCTGIFSNVPDDLYDCHVCKEENSLVVFGSIHKRNAVYRHQRFSDLVKKLSVTTLYDIGPGASNCNLDGIKVCIRGALSPQQLACCLNRVKFGALSYPPHLLGKSGIFSAYAAFGVIPLNLPDTDYPLDDGLVEGKNYFTWKPEITADMFSDDAAKAEILKWYHAHDQKTIAERFKAYL